MRFGSIWLQYWVQLPGPRPRVDPKFAQDVPKVHCVFSDLDYHIKLGKKWVAVAPFDRISLSNQWSYDDLSGAYMSKTTQKSLNRPTAH